MATHLPHFSPLKTKTNPKNQINQPNKQKKKSKKKFIMVPVRLWAICNLNLYSLVLWIAAPLICAFIILFYNASHTEKPVMICPY